MDSAGGARSNRKNKRVVPFPPSASLRSSLAMSRWGFCGSLVSLSSVPESSTPRRRGIGRNGAAAMGETWPPMKKTCRSFSSPARSEAMAPASILRTPATSAGWPSSARRLFQSRGGRRQSLHRHQRRLFDDPAIRPPAAACSYVSMRPTANALAVAGAQAPRRPQQHDYDEMNLGICSTPTVEGNRVYVVTNRCDVLCLDADGMANGNDGPSRRELLHGRTGRAAGRAQAGRRRHLPGSRHAEPAAVFPHDAANCSPLVYGDYVYV